MSNYAKQFAMSKYASGADRSAAKRAERREEKWLYQIVEALKVQLKDQT